MLRAAGADLPPYLPYAGFTVALFAVAGMLAGSIARERAELEALQSALESKVDARTAELAEASRAAQRANDAKSRFLTNMSHELRTPLNAVIGFANLVHKRAVRSRGVLHPQEIDFLDRIRANGAHLLALVDRLLDLSRIEAGAVEIEYAEVDVGRLVSRLLAEMSPRSDDCAVELTAVIPTNLDPVRTDATRLKQILMNLLDNALRFTQRGSVTVRVEATGRAVTAIEVADTGAGIAPERLDELLGAFTQGDETPARKHQGLGLGLAIARNLARILGWELVMRSTPGAGTVARVEMRAKQRGAPAPRTVAPLLPR
jgi:signal transduction histidine kinase